MSMTIYNESISGTAVVEVKIGHQLYLHSNLKSILSNVLVIKMSDNSCR